MAFLDKGAYLLFQLFTVTCLPVASFSCAVTIRLQSSMSQRIRHLLCKQSRDFPGRVPARVGDHRLPGPGHPRPGTLGPCLCWAYLYVIIKARYSLIYSLPFTESKIRSNTELGLWRVKHKTQGLIRKLRYVRVIIAQGRSRSYPKRVSGKFP